MILSIDFETRSTLDLRKTGVYPYAAHPTTGVWCMAWALNDDEPRLWTSASPDPKVPRKVCSAVVHGCELRAWNAQFERIIWREIMVKRYGFPPVKDEQWVDTAAEAAALALPRSLDQAARVLGLDVEKDMAGRRLMLQMAKPRKIGAYRVECEEGCTDGPYRTKAEFPEVCQVQECGAPIVGGVEDPKAVVFWDDEDRRQRLYEYCRQDVRVERAVKERLKPLSPAEREVYLLDQRINDRGVRIDLPLVTAAQELVALATAEGNAELERITNGDVTAVTKVADFTRWLNYRGLDVPNLRKDTVRDLLAGEGLDEDLEQALQIRADVGKSSTAKLAKMVSAVCKDLRARGLFLYHAASTGRWGGKLIQPQNFPRPVIEAEGYIPWVLDREYELIEFEHPAAVVVSSMLRSMLIASPGHRFLAGDFGQIEARVLAWIAGQDDLLELFASGGKVYEEMAAYIYGVPVEEIEDPSERRQVGKNTVLGCGFQMGADRFAEQAQEQTGLVLDRGVKFLLCGECGYATRMAGNEPNSSARCKCREGDFTMAWVREDMAKKAVDGYRTLYAKVPQFWWDINDAALHAVMNPGTIHAVGRNDSIKFVVRGQFLWCRLPSGRFLAYAKPDIRDKRLPEPYEHVVKPSVTYMGVDSKTRKWRRHYTYGGHLTENVVQATARDLLASAMLRIEAAGYGAPVLTAHDEIVCDVPEDFGSLDEFLKLMRTRPKWAAGLPVKAGGWSGNRYRK